MAQREFLAPDGTHWTAWDVTHPPESPSAAHPGLLPEAMREGWLAFESGSQKRRLVPRPGMWATATDEELWELCLRATPVAGRSS